MGKFELRGEKNMKERVGKTAFSVSESWQLGPSTQPCCFSLCCCNVDAMNAVCVCKGCSRVAEGTEAVLAVCCIFLETSETNVFGSFERGT